MKGAHVAWILAAVFLAIELILATHSSNWDYLDESIYTEASAKILVGQSCPLESYFLTLCNYEHPPLVKVLEALSLYMFGWVVPRSALLEAISLGSLPNLSSSFLWFLSFRFFQLLTGTLSIPLTYVIAVKISKNERLAIVAAVLLILEPMFAFFSRTAYLDIPMIFFALCSYATYFARFRLGPISEYLLSGTFLALSVLSKETGIVFIVPLIIYHLLFRDAGWRSKIKEIALIFIGTILVSVGGLQLYDTFGHTPFPTFISQIQYMFGFSNAIACRVTCTAPPSPFGWFFFFTEAYWYDGFSNNTILLWLVVVWIPIGLYSIWRTRAQVTAEGRLFVFALTLFTSTFLENWLIYLDRGTLPWYYLTIVPSLTLGGAYLLTRQAIPKWAKISIFLLLVIGYFWAYFTGPNFLTYD